MTPTERFNGHFNFLDQLDEAIEAALKHYHDAEESDLEELRHLQREAGLARRTLVELCKKFSQPASEGEMQKSAFTQQQDQAAGAKSVAG